MTFQWSWLNKNIEGNYASFTEIKLALNKVKIIMSINTNTIVNTALWEMTYRILLI